MKHILHIIGARPHFMKLAPIYQLMKLESTLEQTIVHTGQHYDEEMSSSFFSEFNLPQPDFDLGVGSAPHLEQISSILLALQEIFQNTRPDLVMVYGDTNSTAAGAIAAAKMGFPVAHVEAGLREWNKQVPEEINKLITDAVTDLFFCPTATAVQNLTAAGVFENVHLTGDVVAGFILDNPGRVENESDFLTQLNLNKKEYILATCHRAANTDSKENLSQIIKALESCPIPVIFLLHPRTKNALTDYDLFIQGGENGIRFIQPTGFWKTQALIKNALRCVTDSGGIIKEAFLHSTPSVIIDTQTEWLEIVEAGWTTIAGPNTEKIIAAMKLPSPIFPPQLHVICGKGAKEVLDATIDFLKS